MAEPFVALLRGINLLGRNKVPMKELAALCEKVGCCEVRTYIASGNVVFAAPTRGCDGLGDKISAAIEKQMGHRPVVLLRSLKEMKAIVSGNPFLQAGVDENLLHVMFLSDKPTAEAVKTLDPNRSPGDEFIVRGKDIYLKLPKGVAESKLNNQFFDSRLKTVSTGRNWRTVTTLLEMMKEVAR
jgi:uncharacterized protein (DUF1697 family)